MDVTRRSLARVLAASALARPSEAQQPAADADLESARQRLRASIEQIAKVKLPMDVEPAVHFKA